MPKAVSKKPARTSRSAASSSAGSAETYGNRDMLLLTILCTAFLAIIFAAFSRNADLAMYAMTAITVVASMAMALVVLLAKD